MPGVQTESHLHHGLLQHLANIQCLVLQHGRLVGQPYPVQVPVWVKVCTSAMPLTVTPKV